MALCKKKTEKLWLWRAYDPIARRTIAWVLGRRDDATCQKLLAKIGLEGKTFVTDDWEGYHRLIPDDQLFTGKDLTVPIEQDNSNIRHFLARFRRRTKVVSKVVEMVDLSLRIYHHFHDNLDAFAEKAAVFRASCLFTITSCFETFLFAVFLLLQRLAIFSTKDHAASSSAAQKKMRQTVQERFSVSKWEYPVHAKGPNIVLP